MRTDVPYLVSQQHVPDLSQILLREDKTHIPTDVRQEPEEKMRALSFTPQTTCPPPRQDPKCPQAALPTFLEQGYSPDDHE